MDRRRRLTCASALGLGLMGMALALPMGASSASAPLTFTPVADAYVSADKPSTNYGTLTRLRVDGSPRVRSYLRFSPSGLSGTVTKATLRVYATSKSSRPVTVSGVANTTWGEKTITSSNAPALNTSTTASVPTVATGTWVSFDVTPLVTGDGAVSMAMATASSTAVAFASRDSSGPKPELVVETDAGTTAPPPPPPPPSAPIAPAATAAPAISGSAVVGQTLTTSNGTWSGDATITLGYAWSRCDSAGAACAPVSSASSASYPLVSADQGHTLRATVTGTNSAGSTSSTSSPSAVVAAAPAPPPPAPSMDGTIRAAFYYPWFPEAWTQLGIFPYTKYHPSLGSYDGSDPAVIKAHIAAMQYGKIQAGIASWWGQGTKTDTRIPLLLNAAAGTGFAWSLYYENESLGDPSVAQITSDLTYIRDHYASSPNFLHRNGKFVVFVYADGADGCGMADRWKQANTVGAFVVLKVFAGYASCASQPDGWHQYSPAVAADSQAGRSYAISPGFDKAGEATRLARDLTRWQQNVRDMIASNAPLQLVTTFNEWGEGTSVESATEWATSSGYGAYLDALHNDGAASSPPAPTTPSATAAPAISGSAVVGQTLSTSNGTWSGGGTIGYGYAWNRCDTSGAACAPISGATSASYPLVAADQGHTLRSTVTATNSAGSGTATSNASAVVAASPPPPPPSAGPCGTAATAPATYKHVVWIWMENHSYSQIIGSSSAPYENSLASQCGLATNYMAITHPSLPNYIAATSGDFWGIADDNPPSSHPLSVPSIYSQVKAAGLTWRDYEESAPGNCPLSSSGNYAVKHDPAPYYTNIRTDCANWDVPLGTTSAGNLVNDINAGTLPGYSFITPNMCNDMHDCSVTTGDTWLSQMVPKILASPNYRSGDTAVIITFDEGSGSNQVMTLVLSPSTPAGARSATAFNHYSLLKTTEEMLGISTFIGHAGDAGTTSMRTAFHL